MAFKIKTISLFFILFIFDLSVFSNEIDEKVKQFILKNPKVIIESLQNYEKQLELERSNDNKNKIFENKKKIFESNNNLFEGNPYSKKKIVEFLDYNCSYCKKVHMDIKKLLSESKDFQVIYKNFPILSDNSVVLAKYAIVISEIDHKKFLEFHNEILAIKGTVKDADLNRILKKINLKKESLVKSLNEASIENKLQSDIELAQKLGLRGTPAFIINDEILFGYIELEEMKAKLNQQ